MKVSIITPVFNSEKHVVGDLKKIMDNVPKDVEIIVVDDGSADRTKALVKEFFSGLKRKNLKLIGIKHGGPAVARNSGWRKASGEIIIFLDSGCKPTKTWFKQMSKPFEEKDVVAVSGVYKSRQKSVVARYIDQQIKLRQKDYYTDNLATYSLAVKKNLVKKIGGFDEDFKTASGEDTVFSYRLKNYGKLVLNKKAVVMTTSHTDSLLKYLKKQFNHAFWRVLIYKKLKMKHVGDKYAGMRILAQPVIAFLSLFFYPLFYFFFLILLVLQVGEARESKGLFFETIAFNILRAYAWMLGMIAGVIKHILRM